MESIKRMINSIHEDVTFYVFKGLGFENFSDWLESTFHASSIKPIFLMGLILGSLASEFEEIMGISPIVYLAFVALITMEFITGLMASLKSGKKIQSRKWGRMILKIGIYSIIIGCLNIFQLNLPSINLQIIDINIYGWFYYVVLNMIIIQILLSVFENLTALGFRETSKVFNVIAQQFEKWFELDKTKD